MTDSPTPSEPLNDSPAPSVPVPETGTFEVDATTVLKAIYYDPKDAAEKDLAALQLKVWHAIEKLLIPETAHEAERRLLDLCFPGWEKRALVQLAAAFGSAMGGEIGKMRGKDNPVKLAALAGVEPSPQ